MGTLHFNSPLHTFNSIYYILLILLFYIPGNIYRQEWELAIYKGSHCFQTLEEERLSAMKDLVIKYHKYNKETAPKLVSVSFILDS